MTSTQGAIAWEVHPKRMRRRTTLRLMTTSAILTSCQILMTRDKLLKTRPKQMEKARVLHLIRSSGVRLRSSRTRDSQSNRQGLQTQEIMVQQLSALSPPAQSRLLDEETMESWPPSPSSTSTSSTRKGA